MKKDKMVFNLLHEEPEDGGWDLYTMDIDFVFYPKESHMYSFNDEPPKNFKGVYKVYYSWAIEKTRGPHPAKVQFSIGCDECSALTDLPTAIRSCISAREEKKLYTMGQEGSDWRLVYRGRGFYPEARVEFFVNSNTSGKGYRFWLSVKRAMQFAEFLDEVNNHMLENGEPI